MYRLRNFHVTLICCIHVPVVILLLLVFELHTIHGVTGRANIDQRAVIHSSLIEA